MQLKNKQKVRALMVLALGTGFVVAAHAQASGPGLYVGASLGAPHYSDSVAGSGTGGDGVAGKVYGGYALTPNFAVEAGLTGLGKVSGLNGRVKGYGGFVDAVGMLPLSNQWSLLGRVGAGHVRMDAPGTKDSGATLKVGLGAQYSLGTNVALRGEWERYRADVFGSKPNIDQYTLGVTYRF